MANDPRDNDINRDPLSGSSDTGLRSTSGTAAGTSSGVTSGSSRTGATPGATGASSSSVRSSMPGSASGASQSSASRGSASEGGANIEGQSQYESSSGPGPQLMTASTLEGDKVVNRQGEDLGEIDEIMIDVPRGRIAYAVMSSGGFLGIGDKLFAIPWSALTLDTDNKCFILDVDKQRLENAPGFDKDHWPSMADETWAREVHEYYGQRAYWESGDL